MGRCLVYFPEIFDTKNYGLIFLVYVYIQYIDTTNYGLIVFFKSPFKSVYFGYLNANFQGFFSHFMHFLKLKQGVRSGSAELLSLDGPSLGTCEK